MTRANIYRTHHCGELRESDIGRQVRVAGWVENIRDHGGVKFLDVRDHYGVVQAVVYDDALLGQVNRECTVSVSGEVVKRSEDTYNAKIATGTVEVRVESLTVLGKCAGNLPFEVASSTETKEEVRLKYRFLDLRNPKVHDKIVLRSAGDRVPAQQDDRNGLSRDADPDPVGILARGGARLPDPQPQASRYVLCPAAGAADFQAIADGVWVRPIFSDRSLLP